MAALTSSAVTVRKAWREGGPAGKVIKHSSLTLVLSGQGSNANPISAAALGFTQLYGCTNITAADGGNAIYMASVDPVANCILILNPGVSATLPYDLTTAAAYLDVWGQ